MNQPSLDSPPSVRDIALSHGIAAAAREMSRDIDGDRRLPDELVALLGDSGLLRAGAPAEVGGLELAPGVALRCAEELARGDASTGLVRVDRDHQQPAGRLPAGREPRRAVRRRARRRRRRLGAARHRRGRWMAASSCPAAGPFCSGITHADVLFAGCMVDGPARAVGGRAAQGRARGPRHLAHAGPARDRQPRRGRRRGLRPRRPRVLAVRRPGRRPPAVPLPGLRVLRAVDRRGRAGQCARRHRRARRAGRRQERAGLDPHAGRAPRHPGGRRRRAEASLRAARALYYDAIDDGLAGEPGRRAGVGRDAQPAAAGGDSRGPDLGRRRARRCTTSPAAPRSTTTRRCSAASATRTPPPRTSRSTRPRANCPAASCSGSPPTPRCCERAHRSRAAVLARPARRGGAGRRAGGRRAGLDTLWIGEMATYDAFALATAVGTAHPACG